MQTLKTEILDCVNHLIAVQERRESILDPENLKFYAICDRLAEMQIKIECGRDIEPPKLLPTSTITKVGNLFGYSPDSLLYLFKLYGIHIFYCRDYPEENSIKIVLQYKDIKDSAYVSTK